MPTFIRARDRGLVEREAVLLGQPSRQVLQPPAHNAVHCGIRTLLDPLGQSPAMLIGQLGSGTRRAAVDQPRRTLRIEPNDPVPHDLRAHPTHPRRLQMGPTIVNRCQRKKTACLGRVLAGPGQRSHSISIKIIPELRPHRHRDLHRVDAIESDFCPAGNPRVTPDAGWYHPHGSMIMEAGGRIMILFMNVERPSPLGPRPRSRHALCLNDRLSRGARDESGRSPRSG